MSEKSSIRRDRDVSEIPDEMLIRRAALSAPVVKRGGQPRWVSVMRKFQLGSTYAWQLCARLDIDPEEMVRR